jgi:hypothetical protein
LISQRRIDRMQSLLDRYATGQLTAAQALRGINWGRRRDPESVVLEMAAKRELLRLMAQKMAPPKRRKRK